MKRTLQILIVVVSALLLAGCHEDLDKRISRLKDDVAALEERVSQLNRSLSSLSDLISALEKNDHISSVTEFPDGGKKAYRITFTSGSSLVLRCGTDGISPIVGVRYNEEYEAYYWTIQMGTDGSPTWMTDSYGLRVRATGAVPQLKIEEGIWWYSYDGTSWNKAGGAPAHGEPGSSVFTSIDTSDPYFVSFAISDFNLFRLPTQRAFDELNELCDRINDEFRTYTELIDKIPGDTFVKSVAEFDENGDKGCRITLESGKVLTIRNGRNSRDSVLLSAKAHTDGKYYWVYRSRASDDYQWLRYKGDMISVTYDDITPRIGITDSLGHFYMTVAYAGGETELMKGSDGKPVEVTGKVVLDFFSSADLSDPSVVVLTMTDGTEIRLPRIREHIPSIEFIYQSRFVAPAKHYMFHLMASVTDTLPSKDVLNSFDAFQQASGLNAEAIAIDSGGYVEDVSYVSFRTEKIKEGVEYNVIYDIHFSTTGDTSSWDPTRRFRIAFFLTWQNRSIMKVAEFERSIPSTSLTLTPETPTLEKGF